MGYVDIARLAEDWPAPVVARTFTQASPAAGADWTITVPGEAEWSVVSLSARFVASAAVATRVPVLAVTDQSVTLFRVPPLVGLTAGLTTDVNWLAGGGPNSTAIVGATIATSLPPITLAPGWTIGPVTTAVDVADQWSRITLTVVEAFTGRREHERDIYQRFVDRLDAFAAGFARKV